MQERVSVRPSFNMYNCRIGVLEQNISSLAVASRWLSFVSTTDFDSTGQKQVIKIKKNQFLSIFWTIASP